MKDNFSVWTVNNISSEDAGKWVHWSDGLTMYITKDNVTITLNSEEIEGIVKSLPRTFGGTY